MTLSALIARVEGGSGEDRILDKAIDVALYPDTSCEPIDWTRRYTTSLDAVLSLIEQKLPGWAIAEIKDGIRHEDGTYCHVRLWCPVNPSLGYKYAANAPTPARAALSSALRAIQSKEGPSHDA